MVVATEQGHIDIWDIESKERQRRIEAGLGIVRTASLSPDGGTVALGTVRSEVGQWDIQTGRKKLTELVGHHSKLTSVVYSTDGRVIATGARDGEVRLWDARTGRQLRKLDSSPYCLLALDPTTSRLASAGKFRGVVHIWDIETGKRLHVLDRGEKRVRQIAFSHNGKHLVTVGSNTNAFRSSRPVTDTLHVWDVETGEHLRQFEFTAASTESMTLLPDDRSVILGAAYDADSRAIQVRDLKTGNQLASVRGHVSSVNSLAYANGVVASGCRDKTIRLWNPVTWETVDVMQGHKEAVTCVAFSSDGSRLASSDKGGSIRLWNVETQMQVHEFRGHEYPCSSLCFFAGRQEAGDGNGERHCVGMGCAS